MEPTTDNQPKQETQSFQPSFFQCFPVFLIPFSMFLFLPLGGKLFYVLLFFWFMETSFLLMVWVYLGTTVYLVMPDRIEIRTGVLVKRSKSIPLDKITEVTWKQNLFQRFFGIGDIFIETAGDKTLEGVFAGVEYPERVALRLLLVKKGSGL